MVWNTWGHLTFIVEHKLLDTWAIFHNSLHHHDACLVPSIWQCSINTCWPYWLISHPGQNPACCQGWGSAGGVVVRSPAHVFPVTVLALRQGHKQIPSSLSDLPTLVSFPICVSIFPARVALLISLILFSFFGIGRWHYPCFNASCVLQITGLWWMEWQETLFSPNHSESHELPFIWMGGDNLSWGGARGCVHPSWRIANTDVEFLFSWDISRQIKATIPSLEHFSFRIPEGSHRFPNKEVSFLLQQLHLAIFFLLFIEN